MSGQNATRTDQFASTSDRLDSILDALDAMATSTAPADAIDPTPSSPTAASEVVAPDVPGRLGQIPHQPDLSAAVPVADPVTAPLPDEPIVSPPKLRVVPEVPDVPDVPDVPEVLDVPDVPEAYLPVPPAIPTFKSTLGEPDFSSFDTGATNDGATTLGQFNTAGLTEAPAPMEPVEPPVEVASSVFSAEAAPVEEIAPVEVASSVFSAEAAPVEEIVPVPAAAPVEEIAPVVAATPFQAAPTEVGDPVDMSDTAVHEEPVAPTLSVVPDHTTDVEPVDTAVPDAAFPVGDEPSTDEVTRPASIFRTQPAPAGETPQTLDHSEPPEDDEDSWVSHHIIEPHTDSTVFDEVPSASAVPSAPTQLVGEDLWRVDTYIDSPSADAAPAKPLPFFADGPSTSTAGADLWQTVDETESMLTSLDPTTPPDAELDADLFAAANVGGTNPNAHVFDPSALEQVPEPAWGEPVAEPTPDLASEGEEEVSARFLTDEDLPIPDFTGVYDETPKDTEAWNVDQAINDGSAEGSLSQKTAMMRRNELDRLRPVTEDSQEEETSKSERKVRPVYLMVILGIALFALILIFLADPMILEQIQSRFNETNS